METKFRYTILAALVSLASSVFSAQQATRNWTMAKIAEDHTNIIEEVKSMGVVTNVLFEPTSIGVTDPDTGSNVCVTLNFTKSDYDALVVSDSNVDGMTNGTEFALCTTNCYRNLGNVKCTDIVGCYEDCGYRLSDGHWQYTTNGTVVTTNAVYSTTNATVMMRFTAVVNGVEYRSTCYQSGIHMFVNENSATNFFKMRSKKITKSVRDNLLYSASVTRRFSFAELFIPSAFAVTMTPDDPVGKESLSIGGIIDVNPKEIASLETDEYKTYRYWSAGSYLTDDDDAGTLGIETIDWGGRPYEIGWDAFVVESGESVIDVANRFNNKFSVVNAESALYDEVFKALEDGLGKTKATQISRARTADGKNALKEAVSQFYKDALKWYAAKRGQYTLEEWCKYVESLKVQDSSDGEVNPFLIYNDTRVEKESESGDDPVPEPPPLVIPKEHYHTVPVGRACGEWKCGVCGIKFNPNNYQYNEGGSRIPGTWPMVHDFQFSINSKHCAKCVNESPNGVCGSASNLDEYHNGWMGVEIKQLVRADKEAYPSKFRFNVGDSERVFCEKCYGDQIVREHQNGAVLLTPTNMWFKGDERSSLTRDKCYHVRYCNTLKYQNIPGNKEICGFGLPYVPYNSEAAEGIFKYEKAGVWTLDSGLDTNDGTENDDRDGHFFRMPEVIGIENTYSNASPSACMRKMICIHNIYKIGETSVNCGCGLEKWVRGLHEQTNVVNSFAIVEDGRMDRNRHRYVNYCQHRGCNYCYTNDVNHVSYRDAFFTNRYDSATDHVKVLHCNKTNEIASLGWNIVTVAPCGQLIDLETNSHVFVRISDAIYFNPEKHAYTKACDLCNWTRTELELEPHRDIEYSDWVPVDGVFHARTPHCKTCDHDLVDEYEEHDGYAESVYSDTFDTYPYHTNRTYTSRSETGPGWTDIVGMHIGESSCRTCGGKFTDLTWRMCVYDKIVHDDANSLDILTCKVCGRSVSTPCHSSLNNYRYINSQKHGCHHSIIPYVLYPNHDLKDHDIDENRHCSKCHSYIPEGPSENVNINDDIDDHEYDGTWDPDWSVSSYEIIAN